MLESNPGPGLGLLLAYLLFGPRALRPSVPAAIIIQFLGGIHEIYFPYVLMKPRLILAAIAGGVAGIGTVHDHRRRPGRHPLAGQHLRLPGRDAPRAATSGCSLGVVVAAAVSFAVASAAARLRPRRDGRGRRASPTRRPPSTPTRPPTVAAPQTVDRPGGCTSMTHDQRLGHQEDRRGLRRRHGQQRDAGQPAARQLKKTGVTVEHAPVNSIPADADLILLPRRAWPSGPGPARRASRS